MYDQTGPGSPFGGESPFRAQWSTGGGGGGVHTMSSEEAENLFSGASPFSDFFQEFFSGGGPEGTSRGPVARRGRDIEHPITLTLERQNEPFQDSRPVRRRKQS